MNKPTLVRVHIPMTAARAKGETAAFRTVLASMVRSGDSKPRPAVALTLRFDNCHPALRPSYIPFVRRLVNF